MCCCIACVLPSVKKMEILAYGKTLRVQFCLGFSGTLTPIVKDPDRAFMSDQVCTVLK